MRLSAGRLASRQQLDLAELAIIQGKPGAALRRVWHGVAASPRPRTLWHIAKSAMKLLLGRDA
jgi:hypothetical protein